MAAAEPVALIIRRALQTRAFVPWVFRAYDSWLGDSRSPWHEALGWATVLGCLALLMALYAFLLTRPAMHYF